MFLNVVRIFGVSAVIALGPVAAIAQSSQPPSELFKSPVERARPEEPPKPVPQIAPIPPSLPPSEKTGEVSVGSVIFDGATFYSEQELQARFAPLTNKLVPFAQLTDAVRKLENDYHDAGFFLTRVRGAIERTSSGTILKVHVLEGYVSSVKLSGDIGPVGNLVYAYLKHLEGIRPLSAAALERYILLAKNIPGVEIKPILGPSKDEPGAVELVAEISRKPFDAFFSDDNRGSSTAGPNELLLEFAANSFTALGDRTSVILYNTPFNKEEVFGQLSEALLLGSDGLALSGYFGYGLLQPGDILLAANYKSRLLLSGLDLEYPVIRRRNMSLWVAGAFDISNARIEQGSSLASKDDLRIFRLGSHATFQDTVFGPSLEGVNNAEFKLHMATPDLFDGTGDKFNPLPRPGENHSFTKLTATVRRLQGLYSWSRTDLAIQIAASGQWSRDILPPAEKFFLGGAEFGRGFYNGEITGDRAVTGDIELQLNDGFNVSAFGAPRNVGLQYYGFYDVGQSWNIRGTDPGRRIESGGIGIRADVTEHVSLQVEGVERFTRRPQADNGNLEREHAIFFRVSGRY